MKQLTLSALVLIATITAVNGQGNPGVTANNHSASIVAGGSSTGSAERNAKQELEVVAPQVIPGTSRPLTSRTLTYGPSSSTENPAPPVGPNSSPTNSSTQVYKLGVGDVLDVQLPGSPNENSTLFTVLEGGLVDYPLARHPVAVGGLTTVEAAARLRASIKVLENPAVIVKVRDYASHSVTINGFVAAPGVKALRREAVPLYVVLSEALVLPEAVRATIVRQGSVLNVVNLADTNASSTLVVSGDVIKVAAESSGPTEFFFAGGAVNAPGEKPYHSGLTLTQAILASGGLNQNASGRVHISRQGSDGRLVTTEYNLRDIQNGKLPDPVLQNGDRLEISKAQ